MVMALEGLRIIDLTIWQHGPVATQLLGDLGAEVIKIEDARGGDPSRDALSLRVLPPAPYNYYWELLSRNKKSVAVDLRRQPKASEVIYRLAGKADVFVSNLRKSTLQEWGLDYQSLAQANPRIIWAHNNTYGPYGPESDMGGYDINGKSRSGLVSVNGPNEGPPIPTPVSTADQNGAYFLAMSILAALVARSLHGIGQEVETSMLAAELFRGGLIVQGYLANGQQPTRYNKENIRNPLFSLYEARDGKWLVLAMPQTDLYWSRFCAVLERSDIEHDPRFNDHDKRTTTYHKELTRALDEAFLARDRDDWIRRLKAAGCLCDPINDYHDVEHDPQVLANDYIVTVDHPTYGPIKQLNLPIHFGKTPGKLRTPAPGLGEHTEEVLLESGFSAGEIEELREQRIIR